MNGAKLGKARSGGVDPGNSGRDAGSWFPPVSGEHVRLVE